MKKFLFTAAAGVVLLLTGCIELTDEITLNKDGSGVMTSTNDMSAMVSMMKSMGGSDEITKEKATDTTISLANVADSITSLNAEEKAMIKKGKLGLNINFAEDKMVTKIELPFSNVGELDKLKALSSRVISYFVSNFGKKSGESVGSGMEEKVPQSDPLEQFYTISYGKGVIEKKYLKDKYEAAKDDEMVKALREMADNGMGMTNNIIINLPAPAKAVTGKKAQLSEDKKKVIIKTGTDDFFDNPSQLEFKIEY